MESRLTQLRAIQEAHRTEIPVSMPTEDNGVVVVYCPDGSSHNFRNPESASQFVEQWRERQERESRNEDA